MRMRWIERLFINSRLREYFLRTREAPRMYSGIHLPGGAPCLEIGAGNGTGMLLISRYTHCSRIIGIDVDPVMVDIARKRLRHPPHWAADIDTRDMSIEVADAARLPFSDETFQAAFGSFVFEHIPDWRKSISEIHRVLQPGGVYSFEEGYIPDRRFLFNRFFGHVTFTERELLNAFCRAGFTIERYERGETTVSAAFGRLRKH